MLSRSSAVILSLTSLSAGVVLGIVLARGGPAVSAQVGGAARGGDVKAADAPAGPDDGLGVRRERDDEAIYDALGRAVRAVPAGRPDVRAGRQGGLARRSCTSSPRRPSGPRRGAGLGSSRRPARA